METIIKAFFGIFFTLLLAAIGVSLLSASIDARNADIFLSDCITEIEDSNFASTVIDGCVSDAMKAGYKLEVGLSASKNDTTKKYAVLTLTYPYKMPIIGLDRDHTVSADIR